MYDLWIHGGTVVDGTGARPQRADVAITEGRIAAVGEVDGPARARLDATGLVVAPGFVDIHTHYDAQVFWDPALSPSCFHGVTTAIGGNCGFSIAPLAPEAGDYLMRMLARVEGMPLASLRAGVPWDWRGFGEYLDRLEGRLAINAGFLVGHSALRRVAMGERAVGQPAGEADLDAMERLLHDALEAGGLGFSSSLAPTHNDGDGQPVPSRFAEPEELSRLAAATGRHAGTTLEFIPAVGAFEERHKELMAALSRAANRPLNWNVLTPNTRNRRVYENQLDASDYAAARGGRVLALTLPQPMTMRLNLVSGFIFDALPGWGEVIALPLEERRRRLADPAVRAELERRADSEEAGLLRFFAAWDRLLVAETFAPENRSFQGRTVGEIAAQLGKRPFDAFLDIALADRLRTSFMPPLAGDDDESWALRAELWRDPRTVIGASDAGAHLDMIDSFSLSTALLGEGVRRRGLLSLEEAVRQITDVPARLYGLRDRGRIAPGWRADLVLFDPDRIGPGPLHTRDDLPEGAMRLYAEAEGIEHVLVRGVEVVRGTRATGATPGAVLRSGRDTETVLARADA